jgi:hypothetical protein
VIVGDFTAELAGEEVVRPQDVSGSIDGNANMVQILPKHEGL